MKVKKSCTIKDRSLTLKADPDIFARLLVICGKRNVSLKEVLTPLVPFHGFSNGRWRFCEVCLIKFADAMVYALLVDCVRVFDGMVIIQQLGSMSFETLGKMSEHVLKCMTSHPGKTIYFVTGQYLDDSLKGGEWQQRATAGSIRIQLSRRDQKQPKQFKKYLNDHIKKVDFTKFFLKDWSDPVHFKAAISEQVLFVTVESECHQFEVIDNEVVS